MSFFQIHSFCMILRATSSLLAVSVASRTLGQENRGQEGNNKERGMTTGARAPGRNDQSTDLDRLKKEETAGPATKISGEPLITPSFARRTEEPKNSAYSSGQFIGQRRRLVLPPGPRTGPVAGWFQHGAFKADTPSHAEMLFCHSQGESVSPAPMDADGGPCDVVHTLDTGLAFVFVPQML